MSGHTEGPWLLDGRTIYVLNAEGFNRFSALVQDAHTPTDELEANAHLMAAAPELLEALELALAPRSIIHMDDRPKLIAAITKGRGES